jgi:hypothetical protein
LGALVDYFHGCAVINRIKHAVDFFHRGVLDKAFSVVVEFKKVDHLFILAFNVFFTSIKYILFAVYARKEYLRISYFLLTFSKARFLAILRAFFAEISQILP